jgi:glycogen(starch) synthase
MRIAYISYEFIGYRSWGGVATSSMMDAKSLSLQEITAVFFIGGDKQSSITFASNIRIEVVPCIDVLDFRTKVVDSFASLHENEQFDVIEACDGDGQGYHLACSYPDLPFVTRCHTPMRVIHHYNADRSSIQSEITEYKLQLLKFLRGYMLSRYLSDFEYRQLSVSNLISCPSALMITTLGNFFPIRAKCEIIPYAVDSINGAKKSGGGPDIKFGFVGSLDVRKGLPELIVALDQLCRSNDNFSFTIVGRQCLSGHALIMFNSLVNRWSEKIKYLGHLDYAATRTVLSSLDVLVVPSLFDNYPLVCIEAALSGCIVSCSNMVGTSMMVSRIDKNLLFRSRSSKSIVRSLTYIIDKYRRKNTWISDLSEQFVNEFSTCHSLEPVGKMHFELLSDVICSYKLSKLQSGFP